MLFTRTSNMGHFRPENVSMSGSLWDAAPTQERLNRAEYPPGEEVGGAPRPPISTSHAQETVANLSTTPQLQVGPSFKLRLAIDTTEETTGEAVTLTDGNRPFCMSYHLKGGFNPNCGGRHSHLHLSSTENGRLAAWKAQLCVSSPTPEMDVDAISLGGSTITTKSRISQSARGGCGGGGRSMQGNDVTTLTTEVEELGSAAN